MKNLILQLLILFTANLCFAQSVKFDFRAKYSEIHPILSESRIFITASIPDGLEFSLTGEIITLENGIKFNFDKPRFIPLDKNQANFDLLNKILKKLCKTEKLDVNKTDPFFTNKQYMMDEIVKYVESIMIKHGYSLTKKDVEKEEIKKIGYDFRWEYYFYKADQESK